MRVLVFHLGQGCAGRNKKTRGGEGGREWHEGQTKAVEFVEKSREEWR